MIIQYQSRGVVSIAGLSRGYIEKGAPVERPYIVSFDVGTYLSSTCAPASSRVFLAFSASSFLAIGSKGVLPSPLIT